MFVRTLTCLLLALVVPLGPTHATEPGAAPARLPATTLACPFCSAIALTFSEQLNNNDVAVVASLEEVPPPSNDPNADFPKATFKIVGVLKGNKIVETGMTFRTQLVGSYPIGQKFLVMGVDPPAIAWTTPMKASDRLFQYLGDIQKLPEKGPDRLVFFQNYFEDEEPAMAFDAYDEFARAPYEDLLAMKDRMHRDKLLAWIKDIENTTVNRRRLYFTMLGVCGTKEDADLLESFIKSGNRKQQAGLDALVACYLTLKGAEGVQLIEDTFLKDTEVDYVDTLAAVSALRFHGTEVDIVPRERIVAAVRHLLDRPKMADMIIPDLARWEDWSVMERLVQMFKDADGDSSWLRVPVITYLRACPKPQAANYIEELRKIDPQAVERADFFLGFGEEADDWGDEDDGAAEAGGSKPKTDSEQPDKSQNEEVKKAKAKASGSGEPEGGSPEPTESALMPTESDRVTFVSTGSQPGGAGDSLAANAPLSQTLPPAAPPLGMVDQSGGMTLSILLVPFAGSAVVFLLMWSVVHGWFERLIF